MVKYNLQRFVEAQRYGSYETALSEIRSGRKTSHWIWYIFPQLKELGRSAIALRYGIQDLDEAREYLKNPVLRNNLVEISEALLALASNDARQVMGGAPDDMKLKSSMTLFAEADPECAVFQQVLDKYFDGRKDERTLSLLGE